jgi:catechol 2,3-dioxygenase-like lactoylglutathione lyase family enzyme
MNVNLEVVSIPVSDVDKALEFYHDRLGWRLDADIRAGRNGWTLQEVTSRRPGREPRVNSVSLTHQRVTERDPLTNRDQLVGLGRVGG